MNLLFSEKRPIKVYIRVRPFNEEEKERNEASALEIYKEESRIKVLDERHSLETSYFFDGVFGEDDDNKRVYSITAKPLISKLLNGINCALLTYGQTGTGKTHTVLAEGSVTNYTIDNLFERINQDVAHMYKINCSFVQVYQDKVYDLLNPECKDELFVREHPKKGIYVANLSHHSVNSAENALDLLNQGRKELIIAETKMVRQSSRSHAIFQLSIERRLDPKGCKTRSSSPAKDDESTQSSQSDMNASCDYEDGDMTAMMLEEDMILRGKIDICDLAGSERLGKTMAEGVRLSEAKHINSSLLELGNVIYALSEGTRRHIPFRNSTLTRLLQECLGPQCRTSFIVCVAPTASEAYETRCSLNFGTRARKITNKERLILNVEVDYKILAKRLARRIECLEEQLDQSGFSHAVLLNKTETEAPISVQTQTEIALAELQNSQQLSNNDAIISTSKFPQLEILIISEIMATLANSTRNVSAGENTDLLYEKISKLLHELMDAVSMQHENYSLTEDHWAEADLKHILKDTMDDLDLLQESIIVDSDTSFQANDTMKYTEYVCKQLEERCQAMEEDMNYCLQKFQGLVIFDEGETLHRKMKKLLEFLDNNRDGEIAEVVNYEAAGFDVEFIAWLISVHMALRLALALLSLPKASTNASGLKIDEIVDKQEDSEMQQLMNDTFESITSIDNDSTLDDFDKSYDNFNSYGVGEDVYAKASTPKRGHFMPLNIQNQLYCAGKGKMTKLMPKESHFHQISSLRMNSRGSSLMEPNMWPTKGCLNVSLASDLSEFDSIDGGTDEMDITHEQKMKHRRLIDSNVTKLEEKCDLLEEKNSKLMRTLNVIMRENKDVNEKLRLMQVEKLKTTREIEDFEHKLSKIRSDKVALECSTNEMKNEQKRAEKEAKRFSLENKQIQIQNHGLQRQISMKDGENESLRQQIAELKTELAASKADMEDSSKKIEELEGKCKEDDLRIKELITDRDGRLTELKAMYVKLEKSLSEGDSEESRKAKGFEVGDDEGTFETELFVAIENNIRIEGIINEVKVKLSKLIDPEKKEEEGNGDAKKKESVVIVDPRNVTNKTMKKKLQQKSRGGETKASVLRRAKSLRNESAKKPVVVNKNNDNIVPRGGKIKELMNEKLKIEKSYKELLLKNEKVEEELKTTKSQIEMLVSECGVLDHELAKMKKNGAVNLETNFELDVTGDESRGFEDSLFLRTRDIDKLSEKHEELRRSLNNSRNRIQELESELAISLDENVATKRHARDMERRYEEAKSEVQHYQGQNYSQKIENTRLRDHVIQLTQELSREQQRVEQLASKVGNMKERNALQVRRLEGEMLKCVKKLDRYRERERVRRQELKQMDNSGKDSSEADSGMVPDHSDENVDLT
eukprot:gene2970-1224_t